MNMLLLYKFIQYFICSQRTMAMLFCIYTTCCSFSQSISVSSFKLLDSDLTANTAGTMEQDQNGDVAALIKVVTTQTGFSFDCGAMGVVKTLQKPSEIWVYVPHGVKKMTIAHPQLGLLRDYYFPIPIEAARTYELVLVSGTVQTIVKQTSRSQYLVLKVTPSNAIVELDNEILPTSNGVAQKFVKLGTYEYRVQAPDYHTAAGRVEVNDPNNKKVVDINLDPAFGWIEIPSHQEYNGAQVFIDNALAGTIPMKSKNLASGEHGVKIVKELYNPFSQTVKVKDNATTLVTPNLSANFSEVTITVDNDADIFVNDEKKGIGMWTGKLAPGTYLLEAKKENNRSTSKTVEISSSHKTYNVQLDAPTPIYGEINITSIPAMAEVYIDGIRKGETPLFIPQMLIGLHKIVIKHEGYNEYSSSISLNEGANNPLEVVLDNKKIAEIKMKCNVTQAILYVDGKKIGGVPKSIKLEEGQHEIKVVAKDYKDYILIIDTEKENGLEHIMNMELKKPKPIKWEDVRLTYNWSDVVGMTNVGDVTERYNHGDNNMKLKWRESNKNRCINRMKKKAAKLGASVILLGTPYNKMNPYQIIWQYMPGSAYK